MGADLDVWNAGNGVDPSGNALPWRWVRVRARTVLGNLSKLVPFTWPNPTYAATVSEYDHITGTAEQVAWRYVASDGNVWDMKDMMVVLIEKMIAETDPTKLKQYRDLASQLRPWPAGYPGSPPFEAGR